MKTIMKKALICLAVCLLAGCSPTTMEEKYKGMTSAQIYAHGEKALTKKKYDTASKDFEGLESVYPFGPEAEQAQEEIVYAYYKNQDYASGLAAAERYIHLYPQGEHVDYVYYMKGLINFDRNSSGLQKAFRVNPAENDTADLRQAFVDFNILVQRFPDSQFAPDARRRMIYIKNVLAQSELDAAKFYFRHKAYVAAINRSNNIIQHYQGSPQVIQALIISEKSNRALGLDKSADEASEILSMNYPQYANQIR